MSKNLVIVESPAKAKTIEKFLGKEFSVMSCYGHIRDLPDKGLAIDIEKEFKPEYEVPAEKKKVVQDLKKKAKSAELVWLASDEDREGEAISWHLSEVLGVKENKLRRIVFHEITKPAIEEAVQNPRKLNMNLVQAQQARRVLDRLVGYEISPVLWKKIRPNLSAGRVQSVAVRLIAEREKEIRVFTPETSFRISGEFNTPAGAPFRAEVSKRPGTAEEAKKILSGMISDTFTVEKVEKKPATKSPAAPFTTSTLQQEASRKLGYSVLQTMTIAQKLYESGLITYMRTDSVNLSTIAIDAAKAEIESSFGAEYSRPKNYVTKSKGAQEAHEAIRPTSMNNKTVDGSSGEMKLYDLIWKRTIASQMSEARLERTVADITSAGTGQKFQARGEVIKFDGFLRVYLESTDQEEGGEEEGLLPAMERGQVVNAKTISAVQKFSQYPARYTEASLVRKLEELGIGRPSTYAPTISTIQKRGYVVKENRDGQKRDCLQFILDKNVVNEVTVSENYGFEKNKLFPTDIGMVVNDFLTTHFGTILDYGFTAEIEEHFDSVAEGNEPWNEMIRKFYTPFHSTVETTLSQADRAKGERVLGTDPASGKPVTVKIGRFGPMVQIGSVEDEVKPRFSGLKKQHRRETITLALALELFKLPRKLGMHNDLEVIASTGRFGPYVKIDKTYASIRPDSGETAFSITLEKAIELVESKKKSEKEKVIRLFPEDPDIQVLNGRYGAYIKSGKKNFRIPKGTDAAKLTLEDCRSIIEKKK